MKGEPSIIHDFLLVVCMLCMLLLCRRHNYHATRKIPVFFFTFLMTNETNADDPIITIGSSNTESQPAFFR